ncbi:MAG: arginine decarboxylase, partial [Schwartzia sp.]|nr:arginine decarboxylase [Schwartzia sp. (in: firmicutes)]
PGLWCFGKEYMGRPGASALDVTKLTVNVAGLGLSGEEAMRLLREKNIQAELSDARNVLFIVSMADTERETERLYEALSAISREYEGTRGTAFCSAATPPTLTAALSPREAFFAARESIPLARAAGRVAAEEITFYPPGIPAIVQGERITAEAIAYLKEMKRIGLKVTGARDSSLEWIDVVE